MTIKALEIKKMDKFILGSKNCFEYEDEYEDLIWEWTNYGLALDCSDEDYEILAEDYNKIKRVYNRLVKEYAYALIK